KILITAITFAFLQVSIGLITPLITKELIDSMTKDIFNWNVVNILLTIFVCQAIFAGLSYYLLSYVGESVVADLRKKIWHRLLRLPLNYFDQNETGETMSRLTQDTYTIKNLISFQFITFITS